MNGVATAPQDQSYLAAFIQGLRQLGWAEGQNLRMDVRWYATDPGLSRIYAAQLIGLMPDVILAAGTPGLTAVQQATSNVPVVFVLVTDPVAQGFVATVRQLRGWPGRARFPVSTTSRRGILSEMCSVAFQATFGAG